MNFVDLATAIHFRVVRARDKGPADLDRVPARLHAEPERFFCLDVPWGESLHQVLSVGVRSHIEPQWGSSGIRRDEQAPRRGMSGFTSPAYSRGAACAQRRPFFSTLAHRARNHCN